MISKIYPRLLKGVILENEIPIGFVVSQEKGKTLYEILKEENNIINKEKSSKVKLIVTLA